jgi:uncharacterized protein
MDRIIKPAGKVFRDPVHNLIRIDPQDGVLLDLIDTPEFQRLRRIRQLGVSSLTFHGAEHSRFAHSMGVLAFAQRIIERFRARYADHDVSKYLEKHALTVKCAALLHDIGHGPFSHLIERAFDGSDHEEQTVALIRDPKGTIQPILGERAELVADIIAHASPHTLLTDIVSSQLDADRMDYLLRDSHATGVQYGKYDPDWLINAMCVGINPNGEPMKNGVTQWRLCLDSARATDAAEQFILARDHMNAQVYFHRVTRGFEVLLLHLFSLSSRISRKGDLPEGTPEVVLSLLKNNGKLSRKEWLSFDETMMTAAFHVWSKPDAKSPQLLLRLSHAFLYRERIYGCVELEPKPKELMTLALNLQKAGLKEGSDWGLDDISSTVYKGIRRRAASKKTADVSDEPDESILVSDGHPASRASPIEVFSERFNYLDSQARDMQRLYFDKAKRTEFETVKGFPHCMEGDSYAENA